MGNSPKNKTLLLCLFAFLFTTLVFAFNDTLISLTESGNNSNISLNWLQNDTFNICNNVLINISLNETNLTELRVTNFSDNMQNISEVILNQTNISLSTELSPYKNKDVKEIKFVGFDYKPQKGVNENIKLKTKSLDKGEKVYSLIQFNKNPSKEDLEVLKKEGIELLEYVSSYSWYASIENDLDKVFESNVEGDIFVKNKKIKDKFLIRSIDEIKPEFKLSQHLRDGQIGDWAKDENGNVYLIVQFHEGVTLDDAEKLMKDNGMEVVSRLKSINALTIKVYGGEN